jgi:hypothetical protein
VVMIPGDGTWYIRVSFERVPKPVFTPETDRQLGPTVIPSKMPIIRSRTVGFLRYGGTAS